MKVHLVCSPDANAQEYINKPKFVYPPNKTDLYGSCGNKVRQARLSHGKEFRLVIYGQARLVVFLRCCDRRGLPLQASSSLSVAPIATTPENKQRRKGLFLKLILT
jgi:hypothetical protein